MLFHFPQEKHCFFFYLQYMHLSNPPCASPWTRRTPYTSVVCFVCGLMSPLFHVYKKKNKINRNKKEGPEQVLLDPKGREARAVISQKNTLIRHMSFKKRYLHEKIRRPTERNLFLSSATRGPGADVAVGN